MLVQGTDHSSDTFQVVASACCQAKNEYRDRERRSTAALVTVRVVVDVEWAA